ncbi:predicted protein [Micromonas commoda]|uniref:START domain-containing protein n=1 Tax=Micromonas commoda (strain RCC299 / NOUM17 / CCMP2709) TaxID=296587 RepID=C1EAQ1_MICCC|nr:predicted protein [Micromonas commoda]ACO64900.1 predicted protein [Micromonas commoda]|eukprot:XP_002503642.1 predicted protein [Micromonas commoda]
MTRIDHADIRNSAEMELANVMRIEEAERDTVRQFFTMLGDGGWSHSGASDGTDIFKLPGERIHRIMGVTRTTATPEEVLTFFSEPKNFDKHFKILDEMFKDGAVVKIGGQGLELAASGSRQRMHKLGNFAALSIGGKDRSGPTDLSDVADGAIGLLDKARRSPVGIKLQSFVRSKILKEHGAASTIASLPSSQDAAIGEALAAGPGASFREGQFKDLPGHALLHGTFRLPAIVPDRDFIWDQVALRLPTGSVLIAGKSVDDAEVSDVPSPKGHVRGAVLTSGYYITPRWSQDGEMEGSQIAFVVQADPKGVLPAWVVNLVAPKQAHNVTRLRKFLDSN